jgi:hypothetical protein
MNTNTDDRPPMEEPLAALERELICAYLKGAGEDPQALMACHDDRARKLLTDASLYATARLSEVESRLHYLQSLRGEA